MSTIVSKLLAAGEWFLSRLPRTDIGDGRGDIFFTRYDLFKCRWFSVYLHRFYRSDTDRCFHDHPWPYITIILRGGYWEEIPAGWYNAEIPGLAEGGPVAWRPSGRMRIWRPPGYIGRHPANWAHRIVLDSSRPRPWSLVFVGRKRRAWGFWTRDGWNPWSPGHPNPVCEG